MSSNPYLKFQIPKIQKSFAPRQKEFLSGKGPNLNIQRFPKSKIADTGFDPQRSFIEFMNKDIIKPLSKSVSEINYYKNWNLPQPNPLLGKYSLNTMKTLTNKETIPKIQNYKYYNFIDWEKVKQENSKKTVDDYIMYQNKKLPFLELKSKFGSFAETKPWVPSNTVNSQNNRSSVDYDILTNKEGGITSKKVVRIDERDIFHKKKGVCEFSNYLNPYNKNFNKDYGELYKNNPNIFKGFNGIFSQMYDSAARNGNIYLPFRRNNSYVSIKHHHSNPDEMVN